MSQRAAALKLYRQLWRKAGELPRQVQAFYRNSIRSGFVSHADEDDPDVLRRIQEQALRDAEWLIAKYSAQQNPRGRRP